MIKRSAHSADNGSAQGRPSPLSEPVVLPLTDSINLHAFAPKDIPYLIVEYFQECRAANILEVRIIHGKGSGVQRNIVRSILEKHPAVDSFSDAPPEAGSWGATVVVLKREG